MTADASVYAPLTNAAYRAHAVKQPAMKLANTGKKPWRETPLVESANLSEAAGWYGAHDFLFSRLFLFIPTVCARCSLPIAVVTRQHLMVAVEIPMRHLYLSLSISMANVHHHLFVVKDISIRLPDTPLQTHSRTPIYPCLPPIQETAH